MLSFISDKFEPLTTARNSFNEFLIKPLTLKHKDWIKSLWLSSTLSSTTSVLKYSPSSTLITSWTALTSLTCWANVTLELDWSITCWLYADLNSLNSLTWFCMSVPNDEIVLALLKTSFFKPVMS